MLLVGTTETPAIAGSRLRAVRCGEICWPYAFLLCSLKLRVAAQTRAALGLGLPGRAVCHLPRSQHPWVPQQDPGHGTPEAAVQSKGGQGFCSTGCLNCGQEVFGS